MKNHVTNIGAALIIFSSLCGASAFRRKRGPAIDAHLVAAQKRGWIRLYRHPGPFVRSAGSGSEYAADVAPGPLRSEYMVCRTGQSLR